MECRGKGPVDTEFPLTARIPDLDGRQSALAFLRSAVKQHLLPSPSARGQRSCTVVAFGSCVRGDARKDSDLDLLVILPDRGAPPPPFPKGKLLEWEADARSDKERFAELASKVSLGAPRPIQVSTVHREALKHDLPAGLRRSIASEGATIFLSDQVSGWVEVMDLG
ncbi:MAG: nucleotidyltransferase domain-containing protein [Halobacteriales archaeon]|nr:nucleotidyltransferase domain-containing protein [Halobacteriales archaeon]